MKLYKQIINTLDKEFLHDEKYLRKPFFYYLIRLIAYDEMLKQILLKAMAPTAIVGITLLLASSFRVSIGGAESIDDAIIIVAMGITWLSSMIYWYIK